MADSEAVRSRRKRLHRAGDHSMCKRCAAVRGEPVPTAAGLPAGAEARLWWLADRLSDAYAADTQNAMLARELRMTLSELMPKGRDAVDDELAGILASMPSPVGDSAHA